MLCTRNTEFAYYIAINRQPIIANKLTRVSDLNSFQAEVFLRTIDQEWEPNPRVPEAKDN